MPAGLDQMPQSRICSSRNFRKSSVLETIGMMPESTTNFWLAGSAMALAKARWIFSTTKAGNPAGPTRALYEPYSVAHSNLPKPPSVSNAGSLATWRVSGAFRIWTWGPSGIEHWVSEKFRLAI